MISWAEFIDTRAGTVEALRDIAESMRVGRAANTASIMHTAAGVLPAAREGWLQHLDLDDALKARVVSWWAWLDSNPKLGAEEEVQQ